MSPILYFVIGVIALGGAIAVVTWLSRANPATLARALTWLGIALGAGIVAFLLLRFAPQFLPLILLIGVPLYLARRSWFRARPWRRGGAAQAGNASMVETAYLRMSLDHASGAMHGQVLRGVFAGRELGSLTLDDLLALRAECETADPQSVRLVESFIDRGFGPDWRTSEASADDGTTGRGQQTRGGGEAAKAGMTRAEALEILGLPAAADRDAIVAAWRKLIKLNHPDHGGSKYIAAKLNEAKRVLLGD